MTANRILIAWLAALVAGSILVALPDTGAPLIRISRTHGPGLLDVVGISVITIGVVTLWWWLIRRRRTIAARVGRRGVLVLALVLVLAFAEVIWSVLADNGPWWIVGATVAMVVQLVALATSGGRS
ncbi:hypothetical protein J7E25_01410 [Agromyces sp. ISL-38]|uniref:hypothetical protein n=1 Tax=Agromyces sp. ISL-38 TaxID=2819107 RepID=UPI001BE66BFE|nr:hypothetical protein [Agromyces sp. ISL-38]MBT2497745.1 hypothetical protein [Agromyces sp. ISL-38]